MCALSHLDKLEAEAIYIIREVAAECEKPVMLYSIGKDSSVMLHLALKAFYPEKPPFPFLHVNTTWKFKEMIRFRDETMKKYGLQLIEYINQEGVKQGVNPFDYGAAYTDIMKTQALKQALHKYGFTAAFGGGRRDEEKSRAKERIFSFRNEAQAWDPKNQRPEMWKLYNTHIHKGESMRVFPISNWAASMTANRHSLVICSMTPNCSTPTRRRPWNWKARSAAAAGPSTTRCSWTASWRNGNRASPST